MASREYEMAPLREEMQDLEAAKLSGEAAPYDGIPN